MPDPRRLDADNHRAAGRRLPFLRYHSTPQVGDNGAGRHVVIVDADTVDDARAFAVSLCRTDARQPAAIESVTPVHRPATEPRRFRFDVRIDDAPACPHCQIRMQYAPALVLNYCAPCGYQVAR